MKSVGDFRKKIKTYHRLHGRDLPWRRTRNPYRILVSEVMLQQTQVERVKTFYEKFIKRFSGFEALANARKDEVLGAWQGLGYNRRALALWETAKIVAERYGGKLPHDRAALESLPGIGPYTAGAIRAFAWNEPEIFIETNIRRTFIRFFFPRRKDVHDREILSLIARTLDVRNPREWYFALMDHGAMLGAAGDDANRRSAHYTRQSGFSGSDREIRGKILRLLLSCQKMSMQDLEGAIARPKERMRGIVDAMAREGFLVKKGNIVQL